MPAKGFKKPLEKCLWEKVSKTATCWLWTGETGSNGYGTIKDFHTQKRRLVHRLSFTLAFGEFDPALIVRHKCDVRACVRPDHLELGTQADNIHDMISRARHLEGQKARVLKLRGRRRAT